MVLVNHEWNTMATPILYEHLTISKMVELKKLLETLTLEEDDGLSLGRFVKRLDITDSDVDAPNGISTSVAIELCQKMVNLVTCFVELEFNCNPDLLLAALGPQLRHLHIHEITSHGNPPSISFDSLLEFLNIHPNLTSISFECWKSLRSTGTGCMMKVPARTSHSLRGGPLAPFVWRISRGRL
ncbi:hypothetical protein D9611_005264 [Ephemerocybe angulata]|uniref:Uncharacterized protein n=1 Tax=Ephemerocybe angulata TaxID=980116 RepID=A0A8H5C041_9AGAR|nr:hypothetical protein D9611_005264 [Tulosesus angulatus]